MVIGYLFIVAGLVRFCADMYLQFRPPEAKKGFGVDVSQVTDLVNALGKLPPWALSAVIGVGLIWLGNYMSQGHVVVK
jgi:hypothetical protein